MWSAPAGAYRGHAHALPLLSVTFASPIVLLPSMPLRRRLNLRRGVCLRLSLLRTLNPRLHPTTAVAPGSQCSYTVKHLAVRRGRTFCHPGARVKDVTSSVLQVRLPRPTSTKFCLRSVSRTSSPWWPACRTRGSGSSFAARFPCLAVVTSPPTAYVSCTCDSLNKSIPTHHTHTLFHQQLLLCHHNLRTFTPSQPVFSTDSWNPELFLNPTAFLTIL